MARYIFLLILLIIPLVSSMVLDVVMSPSDHTVYGSKDFVVNCSALGEEGTVVSNLTLFHNFDGNFVSKQVVENVVLGQVYNFNINNVNEGSYVWNCEAIDNFSNSFMKSNNYTLVVDYGTPNLTILSPLNETYNNTSVDLVLDYFEVNLEGCVYSLNYGSNVSFNCGNISLENVYEGSNHLDVSIKDTLGNSVTKIVDFYVSETDKIVPIVDSINVEYDYGDKNVTLTLDVLTNENSTCRFDNTDDVFEGMELMNSSEDGLTHIQEEYFESELNGTYYVLCKDSSENLMNESAMVNYSIVFKEKSAYEWKDVKPGQSLVYTIDQSSVKKIMLKVKSALEDVGVNVNEVDSVPNSYDGKVYKYFEVKWTNLGNDDIDNAKIVFGIPFEWIDTNGLTRDDIVLLRYTNAWDQMQTTFLRKDQEDYIFESSVPGFSYFVIGVKKENVPLEDGQDIVSSVTSNVVAESLKEDKDDDTAFSPWLLLGLIVLVLILCVGVYVYEHRNDFGNNVL